MSVAPTKPLVAIACGGTGGHLFPGQAVGEELLRRGCDVLLLVSSKEVDQHGAKAAAGMNVATLPAVGLSGGNFAPFVAGLWKSLRAAKQLFRARPPQAVLAMGGFTSAPPVLAGKACGAATFLHEANALPGRANRWLAHVVDQAFVGFAVAAGRLHHQNVLATGTPVRASFQPADAAACRLALGLDARQPVLLALGGSQGASAVNELVVQALPSLKTGAPELQFLHLAGPAEAETVQAAYRAHGRKAVVRGFLTEMDLALGAATVAVSRAGASSLAEFAAMRVPAILVPLPTAADNHQFHNAQEFAASGAALLAEQARTLPAQLADMILNLLADDARRAALSRALARWHSPRAAELIADRMLALVKARGLWRSGEGGAGAGPAAALRIPQSASA